MAGAAHSPSWGRLSWHLRRPALRVHACLHREASCIFIQRICVRIAVCACVNYIHVLMDFSCRFLHAHYLLQQGVKHSDIKHGVLCVSLGVFMRCALTCDVIMCLLIYIRFAL